MGDNKGTVSPRQLHVAAIPGDGIGPEVVSVTMPVLRRAAELAGARVEVEELDWGGARYLREGAAMPPDGAAIVRRYDAVLFGAVGRRDVPDHALVWGLILGLRQALDLYVNLRPVQAWPGIASPVRGSEGVDFVVVRENSEGEYAGTGGRSHAGTPAEAAIEVAVHTRAGIERIAAYAFELARRRGGSVQAVTKSNASKYGYVLWDEVVREVGARYPDVPHELVLVDAMAARMIERPHSLSVLLCSNLFGDILSDLAAPMQGGLGMAPSGNFRPDGLAPGIYEPVHGSAPDIAGTGRANPIACILSAAMLLEHCGLPDGGGRIHAAVRAAISDPAARTPDLGGQGTTGGLARRVLEALEQ
jgi:tartrate dehydrogenase/decarboxylase/D-malate dehydrogenase